LEKQAVAGGRGSANDGPLPGMASTNHRPIEEKLDKQMGEALSHVKSVIGNACDQIVHEFDKGADEMTKEVAAFRPILKQVEAAVQPAIDGLNQIRGIARSVGM
jgi:hypothetical protein